MPYAIAAARAHPGRQAILFVGDGGLEHAAVRARDCAKYELNVKIIVIKNNSLGHLKREQMVFLGNPEFGCDLQPIDFAAVARGFGLRDALHTPGSALISESV